jgi:hypothetical protein
MKNKGISEADKYFKESALKKDISLEALKFINDNRELEVANFYEMIRRNYNQKKSPLYKNIVREEYKEPEEVLTTLAALNLQILLFNKNLEENKKQRFLNHSRVQEIVEVLDNYYKTYDLRPCLKLIYLIKSDLKAFESIRG